MAQSDQYHCLGDYFTRCYDDFRLSELTFILLSRFKRSLMLVLWAAHQVRLLPSESELTFEPHQVTVSFLPTKSWWPVLSKHYYTFALQLGFQDTKEFCDTEAVWKRNRRPFLFCLLSIFVRKFIYYCLKECIKKNHWFLEIFRAIFV